MQTIDFTKLKTYRKQRGFSQERIAELLHMTQSNYNKLETGKKKNQSVELFDQLCSIFKLTPFQLKYLMSTGNAIETTGIKLDENLMIEDLLIDEPLRPDEFVFLSVPIIDLQKGDFTDYYPPLDLESMNDHELVVFFSTVFIEVIRTRFASVGFEYTRNKLTALSIMLGDKKLGTIDPFYMHIINELINLSRLSRVLVIDAEESTPGYYDTYMKAVFVITNVTHSTATFDKGRLQSWRPLTRDEVKAAEEEEDAM